MADTRDQGRDEATYKPEHDALSTGMSRSDTHVVDMNVRPRDATGAQTHPAPQPTVPNSDAGTDEPR